MSGKRSSPQGVAPGGAGIAGSDDRNPGHIACADDALISVSVFASG